MVHIEMWRVRRGTVVVIVSDDRTGGLAMMSAAIAASGFDILMAEAYRRSRDAQPAEAVAFFELRRPSDAEDRPDFEKFRRLKAVDHSKIAGLAAREPRKA